MARNGLKMAKIIVESDFLRIRQKPVLLVSLAFSKSSHALQWPKDYSESVSKVLDSSRRV